MVYLLSVFLLCLAPNLDNMAIGLAYGVRKINVPFKSNFSIALFSGIATFMSSMLGSLLTNYIPVQLGNIIGGSIVCIIGLYTIASYFYNKRKNGEVHESCTQYIDSLKAVINDPSIADRDFSGDISLKESISLGIALAVNCLGTGFGAGLAGINIYILSGSIIVFSLATISLGVIIGKHFAARFSADKATVVSGILLIAVGIYQIL